MGSLKTAEELATNNAISKNYIGYGRDGFHCQIHFPELCKIIEERDNEWRQKIQDAFNSTMNFHTKDILKKLLED